MNEQAKTAAWRWLKTALSGLAAAIVVAVFADLDVFSGIMAGDFTPDFWRSMAQIVVTAVLASIAKYYGLKLPAPKNS